MTSKKTIKIHIPHTEAPGVTIVGTLEQVAPNEPTQGRKIALILHGAMGHKDYLFQKRLAMKLPMDSFRFDFRGNHETGGDFKQGQVQDDVVDIEVVVAYLKREFGYKIDMVVGHSRGSVVAARWICRSEDGRSISAFVNASGRYRMNKIFERATSWMDDINKQGYHEWKVTVARKPVVGRITRESLDDFASWDTSIIWTEFPPQVDVLTLHGVDDRTVPAYDGVIHARALSNRTPGTHTLHLVDEADHNFTGRQDEIVETILEWWHQQQGVQLKTGIWNTGVRSNL